MRRNFNIPNIITCLRIVLLVPFFVFASLIFHDTLIWRKAQTLMTYNYISYPDTNPYVADISEYLPQFIVAICFVLIAMLDILDGYLARKFKVVTNFGRIIDPIADKLQIIGALVLLNVFNFAPVWITIVIVIRDVIITILRFIVKSKNPKFISADKIGKYKTVSQVFAIFLFMVPFWAFSMDLYIVSWVFMVVALILTIVSFLNYIVKYTAVLLD